ncbi:Pre-mRNA-splicing factor ATP-dependent RNA helicase PRP43 [Diaporthe eres]|uniref:RNA helicase n=1 Tax=Diaporthe vaccinii TaxID=105482 RepID=A0ABR4E8H7_9PEZI|nr:Pre-mRNA-splicing factor ATP-dependent RNA helicase PRP43 [Diaporthe eres]
MLAEDDGNNPWTRVPRERTEEYFKLLATRRGLPVAKTRAAFIDTYIKEQVIVYVGETGSGKTTQIPQSVMYADLPMDGGMKIVCTQPRRLAAREVATRVANELDVTLGEEVGYQFRNETVVGPRTRMIYTTDGRLVQESGSDPNLSKYSCIIIDEAHERSETIDLLLGLIKPILQRRRDLKLIIISLKAHRRNPEGSADQSGDGEGLFWQTLDLRL